MKYRIAEKDNKFYPQFYAGYIWWTCRDDNRAIECQSLAEAKKFLDKEVAKETYEDKKNVKIHPYP